MKEEINRHFRIKAIITGATGMVGEGVLHECILHDDVEQVLAVGRRTCGVNHPKLKEIILPDFFNLSTIENQLSGYNACFFCLGTSSVGKSEKIYREVTYDLTMRFAELLSRLNPGMTFCYVSGYGTDSSEKGKLMWARVKGKTENDLMKLPFGKTYNFRPAFMLPTRGLKNAPVFYRCLALLFPLLRFVLPQFACTLREVGLAMIRSVNLECEKKILEVKDIVALAKEKA